MPRKKISERVLTSETMAYLFVWRAADQQKTFRVAARDEKEATRIKFRLYESMKLLMSRPEFRAEYPQLVAARENCSLRADPISPEVAEQMGVNTQEFTWVVTCYRSSEKREVADLISRLGITEEDLRPPKPLSVQAAEEQLAQAVMSAGGGKRETTAQPTCFTTVRMDEADLAASGDPADALLADLLGLKPE